MRRFVLAAIAVVIVFAAGIATARAQLAIRHELLNSTGIYTSNGGGRGWRQSHVPARQPEPRDLHATHHGGRRASLRRSCT